MDALMLGRLMSPFSQGSAQTMAGSVQYSDSESHPSEVASDSDYTELSQAANSPTQILNMEILRALDAALAQGGATLDRSADTADFTPEKIAERVLGFIDSLVGRYAADDPKRMEILEQARDGVERGFEEAEEVLKGLGVLKGEIASNIDRTYYLIQDGLDSLEDQEAVTNTPQADEGPVPADADDSAQAVFQSASFAARQSSSLVIDTLDGDRVTIQIDKQASVTRAAFASDTGEARIRGFESTTEAKAEFSFRVEGDLDEDEREAIENLIARVDKVADKFFDGNVQAAFNKAARLEFDGDELAGFTLDMNRSQHFEAVAAYQRTMPARETVPGLADIATFGAELRNLFGDAGKQAFATPEKSLAGLFNHLVDERAGMGFEQVRENARSMLRDLVDRLVDLRVQEPVNEPAEVEENSAEELESEVVDD